MTMTMPSLWSFLHAPSVELLGWTLLHFVWQGALMAAVLAGALYLLRDHSPRVRYAAGCAALLGLLALPIGTGVILSGSLFAAAPGPSSTMVVVDDVATSAEASRATEPAVASASSWRAWMATQVRPVLPWIVLAWGLGVLGFALRLGGGAWRVRRVRRSSRAAPSEWQDRLRSLADRMGVSAPAGLRQSARVDGPVLAGWWRPVILVPAGFLSGLPPAQVEALLLHELAHVRRHDVLVGRLQAVVETLLFFHPATWWISRQVRQAREACCDDLVVQAGSGRATYAQALAALAERAVEGTAATAWAPAATDGSLLDRIQRLVVPPEAPSTAGRRLSIVAAALLMVTVPVGLAACASQQSSTEMTASAAEPPTEEGPEPSQAPPQDSEEGRAIVSVRDDSSQRVVTVIEREAVEVDSLERVIRGDINPDSLKRLIQTRFNADSLKRMLRERFDLDSLEHRALRVRWQADSLAQRFADRFSDEWAERWREVPDSAFAFQFNGVDPDDFNRSDFDFDLNVDSLVRHHERRADSLRRHVEGLREYMIEKRSERLREQARRLRERAEELEQQAEGMGDRREESENGSSG